MLSKSLGGNHEYSKPGTRRVRIAGGLPNPNPSVPADDAGSFFHGNSLGSSLFRLPLPEAIAEADREDGKEAGVAEIVIVARFERGEVLLEARILTDGLAAHRG
jgi:hypothetical protein